jgi:glucose-6-phosphate 1-dehydrogenase
MAETKLDHGQLKDSLSEGMQNHGDIDKPELYSKIGEKLKQIEDTRHTGGNVLFYLSMQPSQYASTALGIGAGAQRLKLRHGLTHAI